MSFLFALKGSRIAFAVALFLSFLGMDFLGATLQSTSRQPGFPGQAKAQTDAIECGTGNRRYTEIAPLPLSSSRHHA